MSSYIHFTEEQKQRAAAVDLEEFLRCRGEKLLSSGRGALCDNDRNDRFLCGRFQQNIQFFSETGVDKLRGRILQ